MIEKFKDFQWQIIWNYNLLLLSSLFCLLLLQCNKIQTLLFKQFNRLIRLELVEDSRTLSSSTNQSVKLEINVNLLTIESLEAINR